MAKTNNLVFKALYIVSWVIFVGMCIEAGALLVNFIYSFFNPKVLGNLYQKLDLKELYAQSKLIFFGMYGFAIAISILKAILFYVVIMLLHKLDLSKPFSNFASKKILQISYFTFSVGILSIIARGTAQNLSHHGYDLDKLNNFWADGHGFLLMAAVIYVIAQIFKRGIEIQNENDLTI